MPAQGIDVGRVLDEGSWSPHQKAVVFLTALAIVFDGLDNQLLGIAVPAMMREWNVPRGAFAPVLAAGMVGMMIGGAVAGVVGDRGAAVSFGRTGAVLSTYAGAWALEAGGSRAFFVLMAASLSVAFLSLALVRRHVPRT